MPAIIRQPVTLQTLSQAQKPSRGTRHLAHLLQRALRARQRRHLGRYPAHHREDTGITLTDAHAGSRPRLPVGQPRLGAISAR